jgi:hypothetical protein
MSTATAMESETRIDNYQRFNDTDRLTRRQWRRVEHKRSHAMAPFGKKAVPGAKN